MDKIGATHLNINNSASSFGNLSLEWLGVITSIPTVPATHVTMSWAKFPTNVYPVACILRSLGRCKILPKNSPNLFGVPIENDMPVKIIISALVIGKLMSCCNNNCHFIASNIHCINISKITSKSKRKEALSMLSYNWWRYRGRSFWAVISWYTLKTNHAKSNGASI